MPRGNEGTPADRPRAFEQGFASGAAFRRRLWIGAAIAGLLLAAVAGLLAWRQYDSSRQRALDDARARVNLAGSILDTYFQGEISALSAMAASPAVVAQDEPAMTAYFRRVQPKGGTLFNGGIGWLDVKGNSRATSTMPAPRRSVNVADRSYFKAVLATGKPYVSEGIRARRTGKQIIVMAVPTRDARGRLTGVLAGSLLVHPTGNSKRSLELGLAGLALLDRKGQLVFSDLAQPKNAALVSEMNHRKTGLLADAKGLDGSPGHVVAFATAQVPQWTLAIDRPRSAVFAAARRALILELALIAACVFLGAALIGWISLRTRREVEKEQERSEQWSELTRALGGASAIDEVSDALVSSLRTTFPDAYTMVAIEVDGRLGLRLAGTSEEDSLQPIVSANEPLFVNAAELAYESRGPIEIDTEQDLHERLPFLDVALGGRAHSLYGVPLISRGGRGACQGAIVLFFPDERTLDDDERAFVAAHAEQTTEAIARARESERDRDVAVHLQRTLLPTDLPQAEAVDLATRYQAGALGLEVGGDWYDAVRRQDGILHLTVGDVAGRGIIAAAIMGRLRNAFRAYACDHTSPAEIVRRLTRHMGDDEMATTVCMAIDPYTCELTYASAGHLPPVLVDGGDGAISWLDEVSSPPLGFVQATAIREGRMTLRPGATVVAYTDGLVERRGKSIDAGMALLGSVIRGSASVDADGLAAKILNDVALQQNADDDIALLVFRLLEVPSRMAIEIPAHPSVLAGLRRRLRIWLELRGLDEGDRADAVLAISEACNNAVEHAYENNEGTIELELVHEADSLRITIDDHGAWRPVTPSPDRGRGSSIMRSVMDKADIVGDDNGTRVTLERRLTKS